MAPAAHFRKRPQACVILSAMDIMQTFDNAPIGVFDSGLRRAYRAAREIAKALPEGESIIYVGDSARCPYGPRSLSEVDGFVQQHRLMAGAARGQAHRFSRADTAAAAGLAHAQQTFPVPVIGVVEPGARAAAHATRNKRVAGSSQRRPRLSRMPIRRRFATSMRESPCFPRLRRDSSR